jgi:hypothetical protein
MHSVETMEYIVKLMMMGVDPGDDSGLSPMEYPLISLWVLVISNWRLDSTVAEMA